MPNKDPEKRKATAREGYHRRKALGQWKPPDPEKRRAYINKRYRDDPEFRASHNAAQQKLHAKKTLGEGMCWICKGTAKLVKDHDHKTGRLRGKLCSACNLLLGHARESKETLQRAIVYLEVWQEDGSST